MTTKNFVVKNGLTTGNIILDASSSNITANVVVANLSVPATANLGSASNVTITGGVSGYVLSTDGSGHLSWVAQTGGGGGSSTYATIAIDVFTGNGTQTQFTLSVDPGSENNITVNYNGALQLHDAYTYSSGVLTMSEAPANGSTLEVTSIVGLVSSSGSFVVRNYTGTGSTTTFTVSPGTVESSVLVTENGVLQTPTTDYTISGSVLTFVTAPANGVKIQIRELTAAVVTSITGNITLDNLSVTGNTTLHNANVTGNIIPTSNNTFSLGTPTQVWKDIYIGPGSLYVDGQKVLQSNANAVIFSADTNQSLKLNTSGTGDIEFLPAGTGSIAIKGPLQIQAGKSVLSSDGNPIKFSNPINVDSIGSQTANADFVLTGNGSGVVKVDDDLTVTGNLTIQGTTANLSVTSLSVQDNIIDINAETTGTPSQNAGLRVVRGDQTATQLRWLESGTSGKWQYTNDGSTYLDIIGKDTNGNLTANYFVGNGASFGSVSNVKITGGTSGQALITDGNGNLSFGSAGVPAGKIVALNMFLGF